MPASSDYHKYIMFMPPRSLARLLQLAMTPFDRLAGALIYGWKYMKLRLNRCIWQSVQGLKVAGGWLSSHISMGEGFALTTHAGRKEEQSGQVAFSLAVIGLAAKLIRADGRETAEEYQCFCKSFPMPESDSARIRRLFNEAAEDTTTPGFYGRCIAALHPDEPELAEHIMRRLFIVAAADKPVNLTELRYLRQVAEAMQLPSLAFQTLTRRYMGFSSSNPYEVIGVSRHASVNALKEAYHKRLRACHPDKMLHEGGPLRDEMEQEWVSLMTRRAASVTDAYDTIVRTRGLRKAA